MNGAGGFTVAEFEAGARRVLGAGYSIFSKRFDASWVRLYGWPPCERSWLSALWAWVRNEP